MNGPAAFYNECDPFAAQWLRNLIAAGHLAPGAVDARGIALVQPGEIGAGQAHFFAGIGVWSYALRLAGWPDDVPVWTGSCPCQPFSAAGRKRGFADERHLWPEWFRLIRECHPPIILGEQVASAGDWLDVVSRDMEGEGYAFAASVLGAHSVGAPHIRQRFYFVAHADERVGRQGRALYGGGRPRGDAEPRPRLGGRGMPFELANTADARPARREVAGDDCSDARGGQGWCLEPQRGGSTGLVGDSDDAGPQGHRRPGSEHDAQVRQAPQRHDPAPGFWGNAEWIPCSDGKSRPVEPGTFPLAHGAPSRVGRLRAYGNALCAETARCFVSAVMEIL